MDKSNPYFLSSGSHADPATGRCAMEWVSFLSGEPHSDHPSCVDPVLVDVCIAINDAAADDQRQRLRPYLARTIGTAGDGLHNERLTVLSEAQTGDCSCTTCVSEELGGWDIEAQLAMLDRLLPTEVIEMPTPIDAVSVDVFTGAAS